MTDRADRVVALISRIRFEAETMIEAGLRAERAQDAGDELGWIAYMETSLLHARTLVDFLIKKEKATPKKDMRPSDLVTGWNANVELKGLDLGKASGTISSALVHMSWKAHASTPQTYAFDKLAYRVVEGLRRLADYADTQHHHALCATVDDIEKRLDAVDHELVLGP